MSSDSTSHRRWRILADLPPWRRKISQLPGVGLVSISGGQKPAVRVQVNPTALASYGLSLEDVRTALAQANVDQAKGVIDGARQSYTIGANDQLFSSAQYKPIVIAYHNGAPVRLSDVANVIDGTENTLLAAWMNSTPAVIVNIQRQPGANIISVVDRIRNFCHNCQASLPSAVKVQILTDRTTTIRASVKDVEFELALTIVLVVIVIFFFLRNLRATFIPSVAVPLSIVGTFGVMYLLGYSLNNLTLMALTISTGFVVDDAIVMIENIDRYLEAGDSPLDAALKGSGQIGFTIVSLTVSLIAVLIPLLFMGDIVGRLFREFAVTLAVTILVSAGVSLSLTPMMCAKLLKHRKEGEKGRFYDVTEDYYNRVIAFYGRTVKWVLKHQTATLFVTFGTLVLTLVLYVGTESRRFSSVQDAGVILRILGTSRQYFRSIPAYVWTPASASQGDSERQRCGQPVLLHRHRWHQPRLPIRPGRIPINLKPRDERNDDASAIIRRLQPAPARWMDITALHATGAGS